MLTHPSFVSSRSAVTPRHVHHVEWQAPRRRPELRKGRDVAEHDARLGLEEDRPCHQGVLLRRIKPRPGITTDERTASKPMPFATSDASCNLAIAAPFGKDLPAQKDACQEFQGQEIRHDRFLPDPTQDHSRNLPAVENW